MAQVVDATAANVAEAVRRLRAGELVALPTETVYGLAADATRADAVARIFAAKGRPADHPVIVHVLDAAALDAWASTVPSEARRLADAFWPGPLTMIVPKAAHVLDAVTGGQSSVGLRCPAHPVIRAVLSALAHEQPIVGLAAPSANRFGRISPTTAAHVAADHPATDLWVLDGGACDVGLESTIVDLSRLDRGVGPVVLRPGAIDADQLALALGVSLERAPDQAAPRVSGALASHYAPSKPLTIIDAVALAALDADAARHTALLAFEPPNGLPWAWVRKVLPDARQYAHGLYAWLRAMDASPATRLWVEAPPTTAAWAAVHDRLRRAATSLPS